MMDMSDPAVQEMLEQDKQEALARIKGADTYTLIGQSGYGINFDSSTLTLTCDVCGETKSVTGTWRPAAAARLAADTHKTSHEVLDRNGGPDVGQRYEWMRDGK